jgi:hypothetical protein
VQRSWRQRLRANSSQWRPWLFHCGGQCARLIDTCCKFGLEWALGCIAHQDAGLTKGVMDPAVATIVVALIAAVASIAAAYIAAGGKSKKLKPSRSPLPESKNRTPEFFLKFAEQIGDISPYINSNLLRVQYSLDHPDSIPTEPFSICYLWRGWRRSFGCDAYGPSAPEKGATRCALALEVCRNGSVIKEGFIPAQRLAGPIEALSAGVG